LNHQFTASLVGQTIRTDFGSESQPPAEPGEFPADQVFHTVMTGAQLENAAATADELGRPGVQFELTSEGAEIFRDFTAANLGEVLAITLDKEVISAPVISDVIPSGSGIIQGDFTLEEANGLAVQLRYGALPVPLRVVESRTVGPTLGQDSLQNSLVAGVIGLSIVMAFMALYYRLPGVVADLAILVYAVILFALFRTIPVTLTLAGIAGLMLSTGSALDANILIFERLKEELRAGKTLKTALELAFRRAWPSIRDSNTATLITCAILFWFGSSFGATIVQGFALTLFVGVLVSLFTAIIVTRTFLTTIFALVQPGNQERWFGL
jgi:preprotein translocase subunit SecD